MFVFGIILVHIFPVFFRIRTEFGEILRISLYSVPMRENAGKMRTRITPNKDTFCAVLIWNINNESSNWKNLKCHRMLRMGMRLKIYRIGKIILDLLACYNHFSLAWKYWVIAEGCNKMGSFFDLFSGVLITWNGWENSPKSGGYPA